MIKILHIQLLPLLSGVQRVSLNEITDMNRRYPDSFQFNLYCSQRGPLTEAMEVLGVQSTVDKNLKRDISILSDFKALFGIYKHARHLNYDIIHTHTSKAGFLGRIGAKLAGSKVIIHTVHGFSFPAAKNRLTKKIFFLMELLAKHATDRLIVLNESDYTIAVEQLGYCPNKVSIIPNGIDTELFKPINAEVKLQTTLKLVMVGRLWEQKNPMCLLHAIKYLCDKNVAVTLDYIGDGELRSELEDYIEKYDLSAKVQLRGWMKDVHIELPQYDVFVLPSRWEGLPLAILEAMACGLPSIVSDIPGNADLIRHDVNGLLFESENYEDLALQIRKLAEDQEKVRMLSNQARADVVESFSLTSRNDEIKDLYIQLSAEKRS